MEYADEPRVVQDAPEYVIYRDGRVVRTVARNRTRAGKVMKHFRISGYPAVDLRHEERVIKRLVHRLVCAAYHGPPPTPEHEVAHIDGVRVNCHASNLRWSTHRENEADKIVHGTKPERTHSKLTEEAVREIRSAPRYRGLISDLARKYGVVHQTISDVRRGKLWKSVA